MIVIMLAHMYGTHRRRKLNIATPTSERARIVDPRVRRLADAGYSRPSRERVVPATPTSASSSVT